MGFRTVTDPDYNQLRQVEKLNFLRPKLMLPSGSKFYDHGNRPNVIWSNPPLPGILRWYPGFSMVELFSSHGYQTGWRDDSIRVVGSCGGHVDWV